MSTHCCCSSLLGLSLLLVLILAAKVSCDGYNVMNAATDIGETEERVKRQQNIQASFMSDTQQRFTLVLQHVSTDLIANDPALQTISIDGNQTVRYDGASAVFIANDAMMQTKYRGINNFTFLNASGVVLQFGSGDSFPATNGPGILFVQESSAVFSKTKGLNSQIIDAISNLPEIIRPPSVEVIVTNRDTAGVMNLVLNINNTTDPPDGNAVLADDVIELTGSMAFLLSDRQSLVYTGEDLLLITGNSISNRFQMINRFSTLLPVTQAEVSGSEFRRFTSANLPTRILQGPGVLRVGKQGGQDVAFFSNINNVNMQINMDLVDMQLEFRVTGDITAEILARFPPSLIGERLVMLNGAQSFSYPDATSIRMEGTAVSVFSGSNLLQRFDSGTTPTVSAFLGHQIIRSMTAPMTFNIPADAGATLLFNMADNEFFVCPSRNQIIGQSISQAQANAGISPVVTTAQYSLTANEFGVTTLRANVQGAVGGGVDVVQVAPGTMIVDVDNGNFISYKGMTIEILGRNGTVVSNIMGVSPLTINEQGFEYRSSPENFTATFSGPGRLYVDPDNLNGLQRAFYTGNPNVQNSITNFVKGLPELRIDIMMDCNGNVFFQSGRMRLFDLNGASAVTAGPNMAGIYFNNQISIVNAFDVPNNARAIYTAADRHLRVPDPNNPTLNLFDITIPPAPGGQLWEFNGLPINMVDTNMDLTFSFMNGIIYFNPDRGALVASSDTINAGVYGILTNTGNLEASVQDIPGVTQLTVADGRSIVTYTGMSTSRLPQGGTYYISANGNSSIFVANTSFNALVPGIYSQLNPPQVSGVIKLTTAEGDIISTLSSITKTGTINQTDIIHYANKTLFFDPGNHQPIELINRFIVWDGLTVTEYSHLNDDVKFPGPGLFWLEGGTAFYTSNQITVNLIRQRLSKYYNSTSTFSAPFIKSTQRTFRKKIRTVNGGFPQTITVYEGADIVLSCTVPTGNPPPTISFQRRFFNTTSGNFEFRSIVDHCGNARIFQSENTAILTITEIRRNDNINAINGVGVFRCIASNIVGTAMENTTINILPPKSPSIVRGYLPPISNQLNSSERLIPIRAGGGVNGNTLDINFRTVTLLGNSPPVNNAGQITIHIGCKGKGLPRADIAWYELTQIGAGSTDLLTTERMVINDPERNDVNITEPAQGSNVLSVNLSPANTVCRRYICEATNLGGTALGGVDICPQWITYQYAIESQTDCSVTCGSGSIMQTIVCQQFLNGMLNGIVDDSFCKEQHRPSEILTCANNPPCPYWQAGEFGPCSSTCRGGVRTREVTCVQPSFIPLTFELILDKNNDTILTTVRDELCANGSMGRPVDTASCNDDIDCPVCWRGLRWGKCPPSGNHLGCQERTIVCEEYNANDYGCSGKTVSNSICVDLGLQRPRSVRSCGGVICSLGRWVHNRTNSVCSTTCGNGTFHQTVMCMFEGDILEEGFCNPRLHPGDIVPCDPPNQNCPGKCDNEPLFCPVVKMIGCDIQALQALAESCCRSCPEQATPIPLPMTTQSIAQPSMPPGRN